jgi:F-type H+-transporting ATPase subunit epsilon
MIRVKIIMAMGTIFEGEAKQSVELPSVLGRMQVLPDHAPLMAALDKGVVKVDNQEFPINDGIAQVENNEVTVLC